MAKECSFDIVSQVNLQEVDNAVTQAYKEITARYDFKGSPVEATFDGKESITLRAENDFKLKAVVEVLLARMARRNVPTKALEFGKVEHALGGTVRQTVRVRQGIDAKAAKEIVQLIKGTKLKVQPQILEDQVRVTGKSKDDLQAVISLLKERDLPIPLQFVNFRG